MVPAGNTERFEVERCIVPCRAVEKMVRGYISKYGKAGSRSEVCMKLKLSPLAASIFLLNISALIVGESFSKAPTTAVAPATTPILTAAQPAISIEPHFAPEEVIGSVIVKLIDGSQHSLDIAAYAFSHQEIAAAVIRAHQRGVHVRLVMDLKNASGRDSRIPDMVQAGIEVRIRHKDGDQHSKYLIIDEAIVVTGSYNFTARADERNSENVVVIRNAPKVDEAFVVDYQKLLAASEQKKN
jgi:phosphatidylserine/phosphatidylglycerophosphate/cardiolipin synthase-like enzyme